MLSKIQQALKAPKDRRNDFGNYAYRSAEDILESVKPFLGESYIILNDEIILVGDRYYVKATATLHCGEKSFSASAFAREAVVKKGMDEAQITGSVSSYARKYALSGLLAIDNTQDVDSHTPEKETVKDRYLAIKKSVAPDKLKNFNAVVDGYLNERKTTIADMTDSEIEKLISYIEEKRKAK